MPKKILIVANTAWNVAHFRMPLVQALQTEGFNVHTAGHPDGLAEKLPNFHPLPQLIPQGKGILQDLRAYRALSKLYRSLLPDLILHFTIKPNIYGTLAASRIGIPSIPTITGLGYTFLHRSWRNRLVPFLYKRAFSRVERVVFQNTDDRQLLLQKKVVTFDQCQLIRGSGIDANHFHDPTPSFPNHPIFLFIGRLLTDKGVRELLQAMLQLHERHPAAELWLIGDAHSQNPAALPAAELAAFAQRGYVKILGIQDDVRPFLKQCTCLVLPSYREGMPRAVLEAMSMSRPVIVTDVPGCRDTVVAGENGWLVEVRSVQALLEAMAAASRTSSEGLKAMGLKGRQRVLQYFDQQIIVAQYLELVRTNSVQTFFDRLAPTYADRYTDKRPLLAHFHLERLEKATQAFSFPGKKVLDIGCGTGQLYEYLQEQQADYWGIDNSPAMQEHSLIPPERHILGTINDLSENGRYDFIFMLGLTTYLSPAELSEHLWFCRASLSENGVAVISFTNRGSLDFRLRRLLRMVLPKRWTGKGVLGQSFPVRAYTVQEIADQLPDGLQLEKCTWLNQTIFPFNRLFPKLAIRIAGFLPKRSFWSSDFLLTVIRSPRYS